MNAQFSDPQAATVHRVADEQSLADLLEHVTQRLDAGESVDIDELAGAHPQYAARLQELMPTMAVMARWGRGAPGHADKKQSESNGSAISGVLGDFRILGELGRGGMGTVFEAEQISMGRKVALKVLPFAALAQARALQRFRNEVRAAAALDHPHIVPVYSVGEERGIHYYSMQLIRGQSLAAVIHELREKLRPPTKEQDRIQSHEEDLTIDSAPSGSQSTKRDVQAALSTFADPRMQAERFRTAARLGIQAAEALQHAHDQGVLHRDIKPGNLMLDADGNVYVTDFGLARIEADAGMTMTGDIVGTLRYMAPEQALAKRVVIDHRADVYSLGVTLYELLTLQPAFGESDRSDLLNQIAFEEPKPLRKLDRQIPAELETIVLKAMAKNPAERYQSAQQLADDLRAFLEHRAIKAKPPTMVNRIAKWSRRHRPLVISTAVAAASLLIISLGFLVSTNIAITRERNAARDSARREREMAQQAIQEKAQAVNSRKQAERTLLMAVNGFSPVGATFGPDGNFYITSRDVGILRFNGVTGLFVDTFVRPASGGLATPEALAFGSDINEDEVPELYVASRSKHSVLRFDGSTGEYLDTLISRGSGGLSMPTGLAFANSYVYVTSYKTHTILRYDGKTGKFIDEFVKAGSGGLSRPQSPVFGPNGNLYVSSSGNSKVLEYDGTTGEFIRVFIDATGRLRRPEGLAFGPDGTLYVASNFQSRGEILRYDGATGEFMNALATPPDLVVDGQSLVFGPDQQLYVANNPSSTVLRYDMKTDASPQYFITQRKFFDAVLLNYRQLFHTEIADPSLAQRLIRVQVQSGKYGEAIELVDECLKQMPKDALAEILNQEAWRLATASSDSLRNGQGAIRLASKACDLTKYNDAGVIDTLAAAYAEANDFESAIKWQHKAIELDRDNNRDLGLEIRLKRYEANEPWREE